MDDTNASGTPREPTALNLAAAYAELQNLILSSPDVTDFLHELSVLAAAIVPGTHCGITLRRNGEVATVAGNDDVSMRMDELQYLQGRGPCLEAMHTSRRVDVHDMTVEQRWGAYSAHALAHGIQSVVSLPLSVDGDTVGALNLFGGSADAFGEADVARAQAFTHQAATALAILVRQAEALTLDDQLQEALATRAVIDQAMGVLMHAQQLSSRQAFEILRNASQLQNRKVSVIAADIVTKMTGHPPRTADSAERTRLTATGLMADYPRWVDPGPRNADRALRASQKRRPGTPGGTHPAGTNPSVRSPSIR